MQIIIMSLLFPRLFALQWAGLLRLPQCKRSLPADLWPVGRTGSSDPETQRGFAGETSSGGITPRENNNGRVSDESNVFPSKAAHFVIPVLKFPLSLLEQR